MWIVSVWVFVNHEYIFIGALFFPSRNFPQRECGSVSAGNFSFSICRALQPYHREGTYSFLGNFCTMCILWMWALDLHVVKVWCFGFFQETFPPCQVPCHFPTNVGEQSLFLLHGGGSHSKLPVFCSSQFLPCRSLSTGPCLAADPLPSLDDGKETATKVKEPSGLGQEGSAALTKMTRSS